MVRIFARRAKTMAAEAVFDMVASLTCPVCFELPAGEVHQCHQGHCCCVDCWHRLDPRRCPECREHIPPNNRNRDREARIAALAVACDHCSNVTTRGALAEHLRACQQRPTTCTAAATGCRWEGMAAEQVLHELACPFAQDKLLQQWALDEEEEEEGGQRRRQRVGPAPNEPPPSDATVAVMGVVEATAVLRKHLTVARVAEKASKRLRLLGEFSELMPLLQRQGLEAVLETMRADPQVVEVQEEGCAALRKLTVSMYRPINMSHGQQSAAEAGAVEAVLDAMQAHMQVTQVQLLGFNALRCVARCTEVRFGETATEAAVLKAAMEGAPQVVVEAMRAHPQVAAVQETGCMTLVHLCSGTDRDAAMHRVTEVGGRTVLFAALQAFPDLSLPIPTYYLPAAFPGRAPLSEVQSPCRLLLARLPQ